ncbi:MAG: HAD-IC family P-type ATPase [Candidatus Woesearchaeota archaeon]|jgi:Ca2+-transporting ATPase
MGIELEDKSGSKLENITEHKKWHLRSSDEILKDLNTTHKGISTKDAQSRLNKYGLNTIAKENKNSALKILIKNFNSIIIYVLLGSAIISLLTNHSLEFIVICCIILLTGILGFVQEYRAGKAVDALSKLTAKKVIVEREGVEQEILSEYLVPGDLVILRRGMVVPADIRIIDSKGLTADESILTGEAISKLKHSERLEKDSIISEQSNIIFSGTNITAGSGKGIVVETGLNSELGKISETMKEIDEKQSPLQKKIDKMSKKLSYSVLIITALFFIVLLLKGFSLFDTLMLVCAVAVSGIPESFPLALTLALSKGVRNMAKSNALVKDLNAVETLGTTTVICTDKTGTLTENKMRVVRFMLPDGKEVELEGRGYEPKSIFRISGKEIDTKILKKQEELFKTFILCNNSELKFDDSTGSWIISGESTEGALLTLAKSAGYDDSALKETNKRIYEIPFDPSIKYMISVNEEIGKAKNKKGKQTAYMKGAVEKIIEKCSHIKLSNGKLKILSKTEKETILKQVETYSSAPLRVMGFASKKISKNLTPDTHGKLKDIQVKQLEKNFVFEGIVGIEDPIRPDVFDAIKTCHEAGIKVIIVTGDHKSTAESIGKKLGLIKNKADLVIEGSELDKMNDEDLDSSINNVVIFARTTPHHKLRIVSSLQRNGEVVAMTGDGVNDAPALKKADIGISMGKNGTDVAREASNMILADDNFSTIVKAVKEGRSIYSNIRRFVHYLLTGNFTEVSLMVVTTLMGIITPLSAIMILFVNIVTSTFPSLALSIEPPHQKVMKQHPRNPKESLLSSYIMLKTLVLVPLMFGGTLLLFIWELAVKNSGIDKARTIAFATLIMFELFHAYNSRSLHTTIFNKNFFKNKMMFIATGISFTVLMLCVYTGIGQLIFKTVPLGIFDWLAIFLVSGLVIAASEIIKLLIRSEFEEQGKLKGMDMKVE